jgi:hypothetical protein
MSRPHVQVILADHILPGTLREAIRRTGASASFRPLVEAVRAPAGGATDAVVVVVPDNVGELTRSLRVLFDRLADRPRATLLLKSSGGFVPRLAHPATLPVTFGCATDTPGLTARLTTMLEMRASLDRLHQDAVTNRRAEESVTQRYAGQLRLASQVQRDLIPKALPSFGRVSFATLYRPADYVSGDIYDVHRLDETQVAVALADATGHGIPAALLTVFIKRALRGREASNGGYRLLRPDEVLARLNEELLETDLSDCSFVAATYAALDTETLELTLARAGAPYPILRRADGRLELLHPAGGVAGVYAGATFELEHVQLAPGDAVVFCSDGLERIVQPYSAIQDMAGAFARAADVLRAPERLQTGSGVNRRCRRGIAVMSGVACAPVLAAVVEAEDGGGSDPIDSTRPDEPPEVGGSEQPVCEKRALACRERIGPRGDSLLSTPWCRVLANSGPRAALDQLTLRCAALRRMGHPLDDLTVVAMQVQS